jgi:hypothetical protein
MSNQRNYAILNIDDSVVVGVSQLSQAVDLDQYIEIAEYDLDLLGSYFDPISKAFIYKENIVNSPINIEVLSVESALIVNSSMTHITCNELTDIVITGAVDVPDRMFALPVKRSDEKLTLFAVNVIDGQFSAVLNFPTSGQYRYTNEECNIDLPPNTFSVNPIKFDVLRKTGE